MFNEKNSNEIYGNTFKKYTQKIILDKIYPFKYRFRKNKINLRKYVKDKSCVDLGCGSGRGTVFLFNNGAKTVKCIDISKINIKKTKEVVKTFTNKIKYIKTIHTVSHNLKIKSNSQDFVWSNGVLMHTHNPSKTLSEINRILKKGGHAYLYVYGVGGLYWKTVEIFRKNFKHILPKKLIKILEKLGYPTLNVAEYLDDWKVLHLRRYSKKVFEKSLKDNGFKIIKQMKRGLNYDTSEKRFVTNDKIYGDGDLRYLIRKDNNKIKKNLSLNKTSNFKESKKIKKPIQTITKSINKIKDINDKIAYAAKVQFNLRNETNKKKFNLLKFNKFVEN